MDYMTPLEVDNGHLHSSTVKPTSLYNYVSSTTQRHPPTKTAGVTQIVSGNINGDFFNNVFPASEDPDELFGSILSGITLLDF